MMKKQINVYRLSALLLQVTPTPEQVSTLTFKWNEEHFAGFVIANTLRFLKFE